MTLKMVSGLVQLSLLLVTISTTAFSQKAYVVYMGQSNAHFQSHEKTAVHHTMLAEALGNGDLVQDAMLYSYTNAFNGFAANLSPDQISTLSKMDGVVSVIPNTPRYLTTTQSWQFLGLENYDLSYVKAFQTDSPSDLWSQAKFGEDVIIGMVDTGIWPESESFNDDGLSDIPAKWKGACVEGDYFTKSMCNKKLIGAKWFAKGVEAEQTLNSTLNFVSARDREGHGTHTASTAGGSMVANVSINGYASGTAKGGAPKARVAVYKACWVLPENDTIDGSCFIADLMAAMDEAVADGVDLMSMSIGGAPLTYSLSQDGMSIAAFHAMQKGVVTVFAGGNSGPAPSTVDHLEPWTITVGASSLDRRLAANVQLGDSYHTSGATTAEYETVKATLVSGEQLAVENATAALSCLPGSLDPAKTAGKIVFCQRGEVARVLKGMVVKEAGGAGMILGNRDTDGDDVSADAHVLPAVAVVPQVSKFIKEYVKNESNPYAILFPGVTELGVKPSPVVTGFSSVGPSFLIPDVMKPDIIAPGLNILAAWSGAASPTSIEGDNRTVAYNIISGTSMATPHVAGVVALLKAVHPTWSPSAIKSAIMTTALNVDNTQSSIANSQSQPATPFEAGAGMINPIAAANPGLVYDADVEDYTTFLCSLAFNDTDVAIITNTKNPCTTIAKTLKRLPSPSDLNLPSLTIANMQSHRTIRREVTNVDETGSVYKLEVVPPQGISVSVFPSVLKFKKAGEKKRFYVTLKMEPSYNMTAGSYTFGSYTWSNGKRKVRSPLVVGYKAGFSGYK